jgi:hypothetical protein
MQSKYLLEVQSEDLASQESVKAYITRVNEHVNFVCKEANTHETKKLEELKGHAKLLLPESDSLSALIAGMYYHWLVNLLNGASITYDYDIKEEFLFDVVLTELQKAIPETIRAIDDGTSDRNIFIEIARHAAIHEFYVLKIQNKHYQSDLKKKIEIFIDFSNYVSKVDNTFLNDKRTNEYRRKMITVGDDVLALTDEQLKSLITSEQDQKRLITALELLYKEYATAKDSARLQQLGVVYLNCYLISCDTSQENTALIAEVYKCFEPKSSKEYYEVLRIISISMKNVNVKNEAIKKLNVPDSNAEAEKVRIETLRSVESHFAEENVLDTYGKTQEHQEYQLASNNDEKDFSLDGSKQVRLAKPELTLEVLKSQQSMRDYLNKCKQTLVNASKVACQNQSMLQQLRTASELFTLAKADGSNLAISANILAADIYCFWLGNLFIKSNKYVEEFVLNTLLSELNSVNLISEFQVTSSEDSLESARHVAIHMLYFRKDGNVDYNKQITKEAQATLRSQIFVDYCNYVTAIDKKFLNHERIWHYERLMCASPPIFTLTPEQMKCIDQEKFIIALKHLRSVYSKNPEDFRIIPFRFLRKTCLEFYAISYQAGKDNAALVDTIYACFLPLKDDQDQLDYYSALKTISLNAKEPIIRVAAVGKLMIQNRESGLEESRLKILIDVYQNLYESSTGELKKSYQKALVLAQGGLGMIYAKRYRDDHNAEYRSKAYEYFDSAIQLVDKDDATFYKTYCEALRVISWSCFEDNIRQDLITRLERIPVLKDIENLKQEALRHNRDKLQPSIPGNVNKQAEIPLNNTATAPRWLVNDIKSQLLESDEFLQLETYEGKKWLKKDLIKTYLDGIRGAANEKDSLRRAVGKEDPKGEHPHHPGDKTKTLRMRENTGSGAYYFFFFKCLFGESTTDTYAKKLEKKLEEIIRQAENSLVKKN